MSEYLLKFGNTELPNKYITSDGYVDTPNQRTELEAYRDANILLHRVTSPNFKTTIMFTTCPMSLSDKKKFQNIIFQNPNVEDEIYYKNYLIFSLNFY